MRLPTRKTAVAIFIVLLPSSWLFAQKAQKDSAFYAEKTIRGKKKTVLTMDFSGVEKPSSVESFNPLFHFPPIRQDTTGTCWCFGGTSFLESELYRLYGKKIKLSEIFTVYWECVEKARRFVRERGDSEFGQGSEEDAVFLRMKAYGAVRASDYTGLLEGQTRHNHRKMFKEMRKYLNFVQENALWNEDQVLVNIRMILNKYLGKPPEVIEVEDKRMTPKEYLEKALRLPLDDYVSFMSFEYIPFYTQGEYKVPDNWWHNDQYYNLPLEGWYGAIKKAVQNGFTVAIGGDVSEPGKGREEDIAIVPSFDIPQEAINQDSREFRFDNETSTDDHCIHLVGYRHFGGYDWFLIKDSGSSAYEGSLKGYYFFRDDWVKLKMLNFLVHKDAVEELLKKFK